LLFCAANHSSRRSQSLVPKHWPTHLRFCVGMTLSQQYHEIKKLSQI